MSNEEQTIIEENHLVKVINESGVEKETAGTLQTSFNPFFEQAKEWAVKAKSIVVKDESDTDVMLQARESRLALKQIRVDANKKRKELKEDSLRYGKAVQGIYNVIEYFIVPIEKHLQEQEDFIKIKEEQRRNEIAEQRFNKLEKYSEFIPESISIKDLSDDDFDKLLSGAKLQFDEQQRIEHEKELERIEHERIKTLDYNRRKEISSFAFFIPGFDDLNFGKISDEEYALIKDKASSAKKKYDAEQEEIRIENERLKKEQEKKEAEEKKRREAEEKERQKKQAEINRLKKEAEELEKAAKEKKEAEERAEKERIRKENEEAVRKQEEERKRAAAPDKDKLKEFMYSMKSIDYPDLSIQEAKDILGTFIEELSSAISNAENKIIQL
jgi:hypothetical protein